MVFNPAADTPISAGGYLAVMGQPNKLHALEGVLANAIAIEVATHSCEGSRRLPIQRI